MNVFLIVICHYTTKPFVQHFMQHYRHIKRQNIRVIVHGKTNPFVRYNLSVSCTDSFSPQIRDKLTNKMISTLPNDAYFVRTDIDEFFNIHSSNWTTPHCAKMVDRINERFELRAITNKLPITAQFPLCATVRGPVVHTWTNKVIYAPVTMDGHKATYLNAHTIKYGNKLVGGYEQKNCINTGTFSHYSFTQNEVHINTLKRKQGNTYDKTYSNLSKLYEQKNGTWMFTPHTKTLIRKYLVKCPKI